MLEVIDLMAYLRSSVGIFVSLNYSYHSKYGIQGYARNNWYRACQFHYNIQIISYRELFMWYVCIMKVCNPCLIQRYLHRFMGPLLSDLFWWQANLYLYGRK